MSLVNKKLTYSKLWTNSDPETGFPTYEGQESQVRADIQLLFDEAANALNALIDAITAAEIPFESSSAVPAATIQEAIEDVQQQIAEVVAGTIPDDTLTGDKMVQGAVDTRELHDGAVTLDKMADNSVGTDQLLPGAVHTDDINDGAVTPAKLDPNANWFPNKADLVNEGGNIYLKRSQRRLRVGGQNTSYTLSSADAEKVIVFSNSSACTVTIPKNNDILSGAMVGLVCTDAPITITPATGVYLKTIGNGAGGSITISKKNTVVLLFKINSTPVWYALIPGVREGQVGASDLASHAVTSAKLASTDNGGTAAVATKNIQPGAVTYDKTDGQTIQRKIRKATATLSGGGWNSSTKKQTLTITGLKTISDFVASPNNKSGWAAAADAVLYPPVISANNKMTFECDTIPTVDIPITVYFWED